MDEQYIYDKVSGHSKKVTVDPSGVDLTHNQKLVLIIEDLILGMSRKNIVKKYTELWGLYPDTVRTMVKESVIMLNNISPSDKEEIKTISLARLENMYEESDSKNIKDRLKIIDLINRVCGVYETNVNLQSDSDQTIKFDLGI